MPTDPTEIAAGALLDDGNGGRRRLREICANCGAKVTHTYCPVCGQKATDLQRPLAAFLRDALQDFIALDSRLLRTVGRLLWRAGHVAEDYAAGRRARYTPPLRMYLFAALALVMVAALGDLRGGGGANINAGIDVDAETARELIEEFRAEGEANIDPEDLETLERLTDIAERTATGVLDNQTLFKERFSAWLPRVFTVMAFVLAGLTAVVYWRRYFAEHAVFSLYLHAALSIGATIQGLASLVTGSAWPAIVFGVYAALYVPSSLRRFFGGQRWTTALRLIVVAVFYVFFMGVLFAAAAGFELWRFSR